MKPAWDKLMGEYKDSSTILIADVDCTAAGKPLCDANGVQGFPTIKHGDPASLEDYQSGRSYDDLSKFAETLKPLCSPMNMDLCDDEQRAKIEEIQAMSDADRDAKIEEYEQQIKDAEDNFQTELKALQNKYETISKEKEDTIQAVKDSGLALLKSVAAAAKKGKEDL